MAIITLNNRTQRTYDFSQKTLYFAFGRTTPWTDEFSPDPPDETSDSVEEISFIKLADNIKFVKEDVAGTITYRDSKWSEVAPGDIWTENVVAMYMDAELDYDNYPVIGYRQVGILENPLDTSDQVCTLDSYLSNQINSQGILHYIDNRLVTYRASDQVEKVSIILEF